MFRVMSLARLAIAASVLLALVAITFGPAEAAASASCQSSFVVLTDPANPGDQVTHGQTTIVRDSGVLGSYQDGRLAGYAVNGVQDLVINNFTQRADINGTLTASSPDGGSSITLRYTGHADLKSGHATGTFVVVAGTGQFADDHMSGKISAQLVGPVTFQGVDIGLC
ncbi:MAG TPA: hypothetical protein VM450_18460 [Thermomicrobiales bacterium]|nr:hypothetical protein [Thermomicrobiales bacterium]